jgi:hypothetical protein
MLRHTHLTPQRPARAQHQGGLNSQNMALSGTLKQPIARHYRFSKNHMANIDSSQLVERGDYLEVKSK